ncbi:MAG: DUF2953 domain-containing protein [Firmicutes bacterium]|jgi:hypothetical protein|nr:DUF2953 domain-containing protein [Bacillota bacterium]
MRWANMALSAVAALAAVLAVVLYWPFRLDLSITRDSTRTRATARVSPWPFFVSIPFYHRDIPPPTVPIARWTPADLPETFARLRRMARVITSAASLGHRLIELTWHSSIGTGDAALTAVACGGLWTIKSAIAAWACSRWRAGRKKPAFSVTPVFGKAQLVTSFHLVVETALATLLRNARLRAAVLSLAAALRKRRAHEQAAGLEY